MNILVTGGAGFLGGAIVTQLLDRGEDVTSVSRGDYPNLRARGVRTFQGDLADPQVAFDAVAGQDAVFHVAAKAGVWGSALSYRRANVVATENIVGACRQHGVSYLVYTSSPSVTFDGGDACGASNDLPYPESFLAEYPKTKAEAESRVLAANSPTLQTVSLRPHLIWGPGDPHLIPRLIDRGRKGRLRILGDGQNVVDITYVDNAAQAHLNALDALVDGGDVAGKAYFIGQDEPVRLWDWVNDLFSRLGLPPVAQRVSPRLAYAIGFLCEWFYRGARLSGEPPMTRFVARQLATSHWYDPSPARDELGYQPRVTMEEAMTALVASLTENPE
jgi:nucleoside-diphosphate-sugar epimerase